MSFLSHPDDPDSAALSRTFLCGAELEQQRVAKILHDSVCQTFGAAELVISLVRKKTRRLCPELVDDIESLANLLHAAAQELHVLDRSLKPPEPQRDLSSALGSLARELAGKVPCEFCDSADLFLQDPEAVRQLYALARQIVGEAAIALTSTIRISLGKEEGAGAFTITIESNVENVLPEGGAAWQLLQHRATAANATLTMTRLNKAVSVTCRYLLTAL